METITFTEQELSQALISAETLLATAKVDLLLSPTSDKLSIFAERKKNFERLVKMKESGNLIVETKNFINTCFINIGTF